MLDISNSDFDVNIIGDDALSEPNVDLTFALPTDKETYVTIEGNEKVGQSLQMLISFCDYVMGTNINEIYVNNEYAYSVNKSSKTFRSKFQRYMTDKLERSDKMLDDLVTDVVDRELRLKLIKIKDYEQRVKDVKSFVVKYYESENKKNLPSFSSRNFLRMCYVTVIFIFRKVFPSGVWCNRSQYSMMYEKYLKDPMSIIYLPNHQSHVDYILVHLICIRFQLAIPIVIAGENLNVVIFGKILRNLGAIFIKRTFNDEAYTERNLNNALEFLLLNKIPVEVFIEGTRSRDGKVLVPKYGILKSFCDIFLKQRNLENNVDFDMLFQPMSITYERIYEADGYFKELEGYKKKEESMYNIVRNGVSGALMRRRKDEIRLPDSSKVKNAYFHNLRKYVPGKIFVKLGDSFKLSEFIDVKLQLMEKSGIDVQRITAKDLDLRELGFKVMHEINKVSYLTEIALVGGALQTYYYYSEERVFEVGKVIPVLRVLINDLYKEQRFDVIRTNLKLLTEIQNFQDEDLEKLVMMEVARIFRHVQVNFKTKMIRINNPIELLYYKNVTIHLVVHRYLVCFLLSLISSTGAPPVSYRTIEKLFYVLLQFLKSEFLFDYDSNPRHSLSVILESLCSEGKLAFEDNVYRIQDADYFTVVSEVVKPFLRVYVTCTETLVSFGNNRVIDRETSLDSCPTTTEIIGHIQRTARRDLHISKGDKKYIEPIYKQYLLSSMFYMDTLGLIRLFKNKPSKKVFVRLLHEPQVRILHSFFCSLMLTGHDSVLDTETLQRVLDIVNQHSASALAKL